MDIIQLDDIVLENPTLGQLAQLVAKRPELADQNLTVYDSVKDEFYPVGKVCITCEDDVLDAGHHYFEIVT